MVFGVMRYGYKPVIMFADHSITANAYTTQMLDKLWPELEKRREPGYMSRTDWWWQQDGL